MRFDPLKMTICFLLVFFVNAHRVQAQTINDLILMTESFPPFNYMDKGELKGISVDILEKMLETAGSSLTRKDIKIYPWARAFRDALEKKNTVLFLMNRNSVREHYFKWVGPVVPTVYALIAKKDRGIKIDTIEDIGKYKIGVVSKDLGEQLLIEIGIDPGMIDPVPTGETNIIKLNRGRIDLWNYELSVAKWIIHKSGYRVDDYEPVFVLKGNVSSYYAFHVDTKETIIQKLQKALDSLKKKKAGEKESEFDRIVNRYLKFDP